MKPFHTRVPKGLALLQTAKTVLRVLRRSSFSHRLAHAGLGNKECVVLGNGPSLKDDFAARPKFFQERDCFCVNSFALTDFFLAAKPSHYVLLDAAYYVAGTSGNLLDLREKVFAAIQEKLAWPMVLLMPAAARPVLQNHPLASLPNLTLRYFNPTPLLGIKAICHPAFKANLGMPWAGTVVVGAVFAALNLGYRRVHMFGADHSWHENLHLTRDNIVCLKDKHFYDSPDPKATPFFEDAAEEYVFTMPSLFERLADIFKGYFELSGYAKYLGAEVYNLGSGSYVDAFPRLTFDEAEALGKAA